MYIDKHTLCDIYRSAPAHTEKADTGQARRDTPEAGGVRGVKGRGRSSRALLCDMSSPTSAIASTLTEGTAAGAEGTNGASVCDKDCIDGVREMAMGTASGPFPSASWGAGGVLAAVGVGWVDVGWSQVGRNAGEREREGRSPSCNESLTLSTLAMCVCLCVCVFTYAY